MTRLALLDLVRQRLRYLHYGEEILVAETC